MRPALALCALAACRSEWTPDDWPETAEGVVLLAQIAPDSISVSGVLDSVPQDVDVDGKGQTDDRYGFRYRVRDGAGEILTERSTNGPALVETFLDYWSDASGIDILDGLPTLGRFPIVVPLLPGAETVEFEVRDPKNGEYELRGQWDYALLDEARVEPRPELRADPVWLAEGGDSHNSLDIVILPDGYREQDLSLFVSDAELVRDKLLSTEPFASYTDRINIARLDIPSPAAGASFDCPTCGVVDNTFGSIFAIEFVNRVLGSGYSSRVIFQSDQWLVAEALAGVPWDAVLVLVNSEKFGGMAVHYAVVTRGVGDIGETGVHELGHAFGMLGDEYVYDACIRSQELGLPENVTDRPRNPPWEHLVEDGTPLPTPDDQGYTTGAYSGAWNCPELYRPAQQCLMNDTGPFCSACSELLVRRLLRFGDPAASVSVDKRDLVIAGALPDTTVEIALDGEIVATGDASDPPEIPSGKGELSVTLTHRSPVVADDPHGDMQETWHFSR